MGKYNIEKRERGSNIIFPFLSIGEEGKETEILGKKIRSKTIGAGKKII